MRSSSPAIPIPGVDWANNFRVMGLAMALTLALGPSAFPIFVIAALFTRRLALLWTRHIGPPVMNQYIEDERVHGRRVLLAGAAAFIAIWALVDGFNPDRPEMTAAITFLAVMVAMTWFRPAIAVLPILLVSGVGGSGLLLVAAPAIVMLARRDQRLRLSLRRSIRRTAATLVYALTAFLLTLPFANSSAGSPREETSSQSAPETPASPTGDGSWYDKATRWLFQRDPAADTSTPSRPVQLPDGGAEPPPVDETNWFLWLALALGIAALVAGVIWLRRRRNRQPGVAAHGAAALTLARLEAIGESVGRRRDANEGALTFASELAGYTGDQRLGVAGPLVSGDVYGSKAVDGEQVSSQLSQVEANPPPPPPRPPRIERIRSAIGGLPITRRGAALGAAGLIGAGALIWFVAPRLGDLQSPVDRELAFVEQDDAPDEWHELMATPGDGLIAWESCSSGFDNASVGYSSGGLVHRSRPLGAVMHRYLLSSHRNGNLNVGTAEMTGSINMTIETGQLTPLDEAWRISDWESVPLRSLSTIDEVLDATGVRDVVRTEFVDRNDDHFSRFESMPPSWDALYGDDVPPTPISLTSYDLMRVVDIWTDADEIPVRVRMMDDGPDGRWTEWRRLDDVDDARIAVPECAPSTPFANADWIGREPWTPSRTVPLLVDFDEAGNPFSVQPGGRDELTSEPGGALPEALEVLSIGDLYSISTEADEYDDAVDPYTFDLDWADGAEITLFRSDGWPAATRLDAAGASVATWDEIQPFYVYESFLTVVPATEFPILSYEELDEAVEPLWDARNDLLVDLDGEPGDDVLFLTQSDASAVVVGRNDADEIVSILVWEEWFEWRELGFEGTPPPSVVERELQLHECVKGERGTDLAGRCLFDG